MVLVQVHRRLVACDLVAGHLVALLPEAQTSQLRQALPRAGEQTPSLLASSSSHQIFCRVGALLARTENVFWFYLSCGFCLEAS